tara:strand:- start:16417 stop:17784 length:1368 start_codon:yes stop_codon:yes gene_type:complete
MAAIVTNKLKKQILQTVLTRTADSSDRYYIGISRSNPWDNTDTVPTVGNTEREERNFRASLQSILRTTDVSFVAKRYNWSSGSIYSAYNDNQTAIQNSATYPYYVVTANQRVFLCVQQGKADNGTVSTSTVDPDTTGATTAAKATSDGYIWKYLFTIGGTNASKFLSANYLPVSKVDSAAGLSVIEQAQKNVQDGATAGSIIGYRVVSSGAGYSADPTVTINGDGANAKAIAKRTATNQISKIEIDDSANGIPFGSGYSYASVTLSGGSPSTAAVIEPIISVNGLGSDPRDDLGADAIMFNAKAVGTQNGNFMVGQDFRQIGLIKNPKKSNDSDFTGTDARAMRVLTLTSISSGFDSAAVKDAIITGNTTSAKALGDELIASKLHYHFDDSTGFKQFQTGETVFLDSGTGITAVISTDSEGAIKPFSGKILYLENRSAVVRDTAQTEDVKLIVQL